MAQLNFNADPKFYQISVKNADGELTKIYPVTSSKVTLLDITDPTLAKYPTETTVQKALIGLNSRVDSVGAPDQFEAIINDESGITLPTKKGHYYVIGSAGTYYGHILEKDDRLYVYNAVAAGRTPTTADFQAVQGNMLLQNKAFDSMPQAADIADVAIGGNIFVSVDTTTL